MRRMLAVSAAAAAALASPGVAYGDITVRFDRTTARPGELVRATSASFYLSLYLVPVGKVPPLRPCRTRSGARAICSPTSLGPPRRRGWRWIGRFFPSRPSFRFRIPDLPAGRYRGVVYCPPCVRGPRGGLIAGEQVLRIA